MGKSMEDGRTRKTVMIPGGTDGGRGGYTEQLRWYFSIFADYGV